MHTCEEGKYVFKQSRTNQSYLILSAFPFLEVNTSIFGLELRGQRSESASSACILFTLVSQAQAMAGRGDWDGWGDGWLAKLQPGLQNNAAFHAQGESPPPLSLRSSCSFFSTVPAFWCRLALGATHLSILGKLWQPASLQGFGTVQNLWIHLIFPVWLVRQNGQFSGGNEHPERVSDLSCARTRALGINTG